MSKAPGMPGNPPARHGQVTADIRVQQCEGPTAMVLPANATGAANRVKVGSCLTVHVTSGAGGHLVVFNRDAEGVTRQIFPNSNGIRGPILPTTLGKRQPLMISLLQVPFGRPQRGSVASSSNSDIPAMRCTG